MATASIPATEWPEIRTEHKPGTRWWWLGSAVDKENLSWNLQNLHQVGIGSVEITPIYGVKGEEAREIAYLSPRWMEMLNYVQSEASSLNMIVDLSGGTGWPFGGPEIDPAHAASRQLVQRYQLEGSTSSSSSSSSVDSEAAAKQSINLEVKDSRQQPYAQLQALLFVSSDGSREILPLDDVKDNLLEFPADKKGELIALYCGRTLQKVKRAAPGGEGLVMNHLSKEALDHYLKKFDRAFEQSAAAWPNAFFNDSYEVYGADCRSNCWRNSCSAEPTIYVCICRNYWAKAIPKLLPESSATIGKPLRICCWIISLFPGQNGHMPVVPKPETKPMVLRVIYSISMPPWTFPNASHSAVPTLIYLICG
jgi:hypothetical protein